MTIATREYYSRLEEKRQRDKLDALINASELLNKFNNKKHLATCAKNRKKRKSKRKNR